MSDGIMITIGDDGEATLYDDIYDITIHCESNEEQDEVKRVLQNVPHWIPVTKDLPKESGHYIVTTRTVCIPINLLHPELDRYSNNVRIDYFRAYDNKFDLPSTVAWWSEPLPEPYEGGDGMSIKLKPCPFCGGKARLWKSAFFSCEAKVMCPTCRIQTATYKEANMDNAVWFAVNAWNRRVTE